MPDFPPLDIELRSLRRRLYEQGIAKRYAERLVVELREHRDDLEAERLAAGDARSVAAAKAIQRLGSDSVIVAQVLARPELRGRWSRFRAACRALQSLDMGTLHWSGGGVAAPVIERLI